MGNNDLKPYAQKLCDCIGQGAPALDLSNHALKDFPELVGTRVLWDLEGIVGLIFFPDSSIDGVGFSSSQ